MSSRRARIGAATMAAVFLMVGAATAFAQDAPTTGDAAGQPPTGTEGAGTLQTPPVPATPPEVTPETTPPPTTELQPTPTPLTEPAQPTTTQPITQPTAPAMTAEPVTAAGAVTVDIPSVVITDPQGVMVPPQDRGPLTIGSFNAAVRLQSQHVTRLNRLGTVAGERITLINVRNLNPGPVTARTDQGAGASPSTPIDNAISQAETRSAERAQAAARANASLSSALQAANISIENVLAIAVRGHNLNDVTVYHR